MKNKVLVVLALAFVLTFNMYACSNGGNNSEKATTQDVKEPKEEKSQSSSKEESKEEEKSSEATELIQEEGDLGDYHIKIKDAVQSTDDNGSPMLVVHYDFTNNGEEIDSPYWVLAINAYQDGVLLDTAFANSNPDYDYDKENEEVVPGKSAEDCQHAFVLIGSSDVEFEVELLVDPESGKIAKTFTLE